MPWWFWAFMTVFFVALGAVAWTSGARAPQPAAVHLECECRPR